MRTLSFMPDKGKALEEMKIRERLSKVKTDSLIGTFIGWGLANHKSLKEICKIVLDQYQETPKDILKSINEETILLIKKTYC